MCLYITLIVTNFKLNFMMYFDFRYDWNLDLGLKCFMIPRPGLNHISYNDVKILNTITITILSQMIKKLKKENLKKTDFVPLYYPCWSTRSGSIPSDRQTHNIRMWSATTR